MQPNLDVYTGVDPDTIYENGDRSLTFFYTGGMYVQPYPTNHDDMLRRDPKLFFDVFPALESHLPASQRVDFLTYNRTSRNPSFDNILIKAGFNPDQVAETRGSRGKAIKFGRALLGRIGELYGDLVLALWQSTTNKNFSAAKTDPEFTKVFSQYYGNLDELIVVGFNEKPQPWTTNGSNNTKGPTQPASDDTRKRQSDPTPQVYSINGHQLTISQLNMLRGFLHSKPQESDEWKLSAAILCSDDLTKYPELNAYRPAFCQNQTVPMSKAEKWLQQSKDLYQTQSAAGQKPSTNLLYPAWRGTSEQRLSFKKFFNDNSST